MKLDINLIFYYTKFNIDLLNIILKYARPNRSFKSKTASLITQALKNKNKQFNPIVFQDKFFVLFWKTRTQMPLEIYFLYRKLLKTPTYYKRMCN